MEIEEILSTICDCTFEANDWNTLIRDCKPLTSSWDNIGGYLGLPFEIIDRIKRDNPNNSCTCWNEALKEWIKQSYDTKKYGQPSWRTLLEAISEHDKLLFKKLATKYRKDLVCKTCCMKYLPPNMSMDEKEQLHQKLNAESEKMIYKFQNLYSAIRDSLRERKVPITELVHHLELLGSIQPVYKDLNLPVLRCQLPGLAGVNSTDAVMSVVKDYCSFFNYSMLEHIINQVGTEQDKLILVRYKEDFAKYAKRHLYKCPKEVGKCSNCQDQVAMFVILDEAFYNCNLSHVHSFVSKLREILNIPSEAVLKLCDIKSGSIQLIFQLPLFFYQVIFPLSSEQEHALSNEELKVIQLSCEGYRFKKSGNKAETSAGNITDSDSAFNESAISDSMKTDASARETKSTLGETYFSEDMIDIEVENLALEHTGTDMKTSTSNELLQVSLMGGLSVVKELIEEKKVNPLVKDKYGNTALHYAAKGGKLAVLRYFIKFVDCNVSCAGYCGWTPLHYAARYSHFEIVQYLVSTLQVEPMCLTNAGLTSLHTACMGRAKSSTLIVCYLINEMSKYLPQKEVACLQDNYGWTPLHLAAKSNNYEVVRYLVEEQKVDPLCYTKRGSTPLHEASFSEVNVVRYLVKEMSKQISTKDVMNDCNRDGHAPIHLATSNGHLATVKLFINDFGCDPNIQDSKGGIPLHYAARNGHLHIVQYLIEKHKCNPMHLDDDQVTPLHVAASRGHLDVVKYLALEQACDPNCIDRFNDTPLHPAALFGHLKVLQFFIEVLHCSPTVKGQHNTTPLELADGLGHHEVVKYLKSKYLT